MPKKMVDVREVAINEYCKEYKASIAGQLKPYLDDFMELREMASDDVSSALADTLDSVFRVLAKNGIC